MRLQHVEVSTFNYLFSNKVCKFSFLLLVLCIQSVVNVSLVLPHLLHHVVPYKEVVDDVELLLPLLTEGHRLPVLYKS